MIRAWIDNKQVQKALRSIDKYNKDVQEGVKKEIAKSTIQIESRAKVNTPVDTGRLRSSLNSSIQANRGEVLTNVEYAPFVEFGTYKQSAKPFLFPAWNAIRPKFISAIKSILKRK